MILYGILQAQARLCQCLGGRNAYSVRHSLRYFPNEGLSSWRKHTVCIYNKWQKLHITCPYKITVSSIFNTLIRCTVSRSRPHCLHRTFFIAAEVDDRNIDRKWASCVPAQQCVENSVNAVVVVDVHLSAWTTARNAAQCNEFIPHCIVHTVAVGSLHTREGVVSLSVRHTPLIAEIAQSVSVVHSAACTTATPRGIVLIRKPGEWDTFLHQGVQCHVAGSATPEAGLTLDVIGWGCHREEYL